MLLACSFITSLHLQAAQQDAIADIVNNKGQLEEPLHQEVEEEQGGSTSLLQLVPAASVRGEAAAAESQTLPVNLTMAYQKEHDVG